MPVPTTYHHEREALATMRHGKRFIQTVINPTEVSFTNMVWRWGGCHVVYTQRHQFWVEYDMRNEKRASANRMHYFCAPDHRQDLFLSMRLLALRQIEAAKNNNKKPGG